jgi:hypothetical protein
MIIDTTSIGNRNKLGLMSNKNTNIIPASVFNK